MTSRLGSHERILLALAATLCLIVPVGQGAEAPPAEGAPATAVITDQVLDVPIQRRERVIGSLRAAATAILAALEEGPLVGVEVKEAARVAAGDVLARVDTRRLAAERREQEARIAAAEAALVEQEAELANDERDLESLAAAARENAVSQRTLRDAETAVQTTRARVDAARQSLLALQAGLEHLQVRIDDAEVKAPFDGQVVARHAEPGEWVRPGDPLLTVQSIGVAEAWLEVPERLLASLRTDPREIQVELAATGVAHDAERVRVLPMVDDRARTFHVIVDLADPEGRLASGMSVNAWLPVGEATHQVLVPKDALVRRDQATYVHRIVADDAGERAEQVPVEVLFELPRHVAVARGALGAADRVVVEGNERLLPGAAVQSVPTADPAASATAALRGGR